MFCFCFCYDGIMNITHIAREFSSVKLLGVGESSHGTHEFFEFKFELLKELVTKYDFNTILFEDSSKACGEINSFISANNKANIDDLMLLLYSVWRVEELKELILWLKENYKNHKVEFVGFDIEQNEKNLKKRDELMAENIRKHLNIRPTTKALVWAHNSHLQVTPSNFNQKPMGLFLKLNFGARYATLALLFGKGSVSSTKLSLDAQPNSDRTLNTIRVDSIPERLAESKLNKLNNEPYFLSKKEINKIPNSLTLIRSIGWGTVPELVNKYVEQTNLKISFDGIIYFPNTTASLPLR